MEPEIASMTCDVKEKAGMVGGLLREISPIWGTVTFQPRPRGWEQERQEQRGRGLGRANTQKMSLWRLERAGHILKSL